ncbi:MAG: hypothetical protein IPL04_02770 [Chitinophagaceae bacterium]|nr:hypothetical protein [Chitinophagaceae bacterium]
MKKTIIGQQAVTKFLVEALQTFSKGLNYDRGHVPSANGEEFALKYVLAAFAGKENIVLFDVSANRGQYLTMAKIQLRKGFKFIASSHKFLRSPFLKK